MALTLNERIGVEAILPKIDRAWYHQLIVVDGGSKDGTVEWCLANGYEVYAQQKPGIRHAYTEVMPLVTGDVILTLSPDGNCDVSKISEMIYSLNGWQIVREDGVHWMADMVIGSRYLHCKSDDDTPLTAFGNWCFNFAARWLYGYRGTDCMVIYRAFRRELFYELDLDKDSSYRYAERLFRTVLSIEPLMTIRALKKGKRIAEISAGEPARIGGVTKRETWAWGFSYLLQFIVERFTWK